MTRFEIQDIAFQNNVGITFVAIDRASGNKVALRRFFLSGQNHSGITKDKLDAYIKVCEKLSAIKHPALRSVIHGEVDPVDATPYIVTEWVDGAPLPIALGGQVMEPNLTIDLVRRAIEVSIVISNVLDEQAVWIDTTLQSVIVDNQTGGRGFTFRVCPFRWLGAYPITNDLTPIAKFAEELAGWKPKLYSESAGMGLGGWIKSIRQSPRITLTEALESLVSTTSNTTLTTTPTTTFSPLTPTKSPITQNALQPVLKSPSSGTDSKKTILWSIAAIVIISLISVAAYQNQPKMISESSSIAATPQTEPEVAQIKAYKPEARKPEVASMEVAMQPAMKMERPTIQRASARVGNQGRARVMQATPRTQEKTNKTTIATPGDIFTPDDVSQIENLETLTPVKLQGTLILAQLSNTQKSIYLVFSDPYKQGQIRGVAHQGDFKDDYDPKTFDKFIGKEIIINGVFKKESSKNPLLVKITSIKQISIVSK